MFTLAGSTVKRWMDLWMKSLKSVMITILIIKSFKPLNQLAIHEDACFDYFV